VTNSILIPVADSPSARAAVDYVAGLFLSPDNVRITLLHVNRRPSGGEELMGYRYIAALPERGNHAMQRARNILVSSGLKPERIHTEIVSGSFATVGDGIIEYFNKNPHTLVVIGRKKMSKAEEFVLGDVSVKLVRALENTAVMVVKTL
jgi:nucleotide-binding universal stress UspA family protein